MLALIVHELTTNAVKYGALSSEAGRVYLTWSKRNQTLRLKWAEYGGPKPSEFVQHGFGTKLLLTSVGQFNGSVTSESKPTGLCVRFSMDLLAANRPLQTHIGSAYAIVGEKFAAASG